MAVPVLTDVTTDVLRQLGQVPSVRRGQHPEPWPPRSLVTDPGAVTCIDPVAVLNQQLRFTRRASPAAGNEHRVLEVPGGSVPALLAVSYPRAVVQRTGDALPFLVYFRPTQYQNRPKPGKPGYYLVPGMRPYPYGWDYLSYGLWFYLNYVGDPLTHDPSPKGLPHQVHFGGRRVVLVVPLNKPDHRPAREFGRAVRGAELTDLLLGVQRFILERTRSRTPPLREIGRVAVAGFSSGNCAVTELLRGSRNTRLVKDLLREVYLFDPPMWTQAVPAAMAWARDDRRGTRSIRLYTQQTSAYRQLVGGLPPIGIEPAPQQGGKNKREVEIPVLATRAQHSAAFLPAEGWQRAVTAQDPAAWQRLLQAFPGPNPPAQYAHQAISATMLADALRQSGFPSSP